MKTYELMSIFGKNKKSYYGKAVVIEDELGNLYLQSYSTIVCGIVDGNFVKYWNNYSTTTMQHINDFRQQNNFSAMNKKEWENFSCDPASIRSINSNYTVTYY